MKTNTMGQTNFERSFFRLCVERDSFCLEKLIEQWSSNNDLHIVFVIKFKDIGRLRSCFSE